MRILTRLLPSVGSKLVHVKRGGSLYRFQLEVLVRDKGHVVIDIKSNPIKNQYLEIP